MTTENPYQAPATGGNLKRTRRRSGVRRDYAGFGQRLAATVLDVLLLALLVGVLATLIFEDFDYLEYLDKGDIRGTVFDSIMQAVYTIGLWGLAGATLGKAALRIKVVDAQGGVPGIGRAVLRYIGYLVFGVLTLGISFLWMLWDDDSQCLHDKIAGTYVVRRPKPGRAT